MITEILLGIQRQRKDGRIVTDAQMTEEFDEFYSPSDVLAALELAEALGLIEHETEGEISVIKADDDTFRQYLGFIDEWESIRKTITDK